MVAGPARSPLSRPALLLSCAIAFAPTLVRAQSAPCWYEHGVVVVSASVAGIAGDYILDTGAPATLIHETRAQAAGFEGVELRGEVRVAGMRLADRPIRVADLDAPTFAFPTPIAGVIGADVLAGKILDIDFAPCRVAIWRPGAEPRFGADFTLPLEPERSLPTIRAAVADGPHALQGAFVVSTGLDAPVRLAQGYATTRPGLSDPAALLPTGGRRARLRALSLAGELFEDLPAGLMAAETDGPLGAIGPGVLERWRVRIDFARRVFRLAK